MDSTEFINQGNVSFQALREIAHEGRLYAVVDACDTPQVPVKSAEMGSARAICLYRGSAEYNYWAFAPYLWSVDPELLDWIVAELWQQPWGIFAVANGNLEAVRRHFRHLLLVQAPNGEQWYFRFYDPRVLMNFLTSCGPVELAEFFGSIHSYLTTGPDLKILECRRASTNRSIRIRRQISPRLPYLSFHPDGRTSLAATGQAQKSNTHLTISVKQTATLSRSVRMEFYLRAFKYVREYFPNEAARYTNRALRRIIKEGVSTAKKYDIVRERDVMQFIEICVFLGSNFDSSDEHQSAQDLLRAPGYSIPERLSLLYDYVATSQ